MRPSRPSAAGLRQRRRGSAQLQSRVLVDADDLEEPGNRPGRVEDDDGAVPVSRPCQLEECTRTAAVQERELAEIEDHLACEDVAERLG